MMRQRKITCEYCGNTKIIRDPELNCATVQEIDPDTGKPIGDLKIFDIYKCLSCGEQIYLEKFKTIAI